MFTSSKQDSSTPPTRGDTADAFPDAFPSSKRNTSLGTSLVESSPLHLGCVNNSIGNCKRYSHDHDHDHNHYHNHVTITIATALSYLSNKAAEDRGLGHEVRTAIRLDSRKTHRSFGIVEVYLPTCQGYRYNRSDPRGRGLGHAFAFRTLCKVVAQEEARRLEDEKFRSLWSVASRHVISCSATQERSHSGYTGKSFAETSFDDARQAQPRPPRFDGKFGFRRQEYARAVNSNDSTYGLHHTRRPSALGNRFSTSKHFACRISTVKLSRANFGGYLVMSATGTDG